MQGNEVYMLTNKKSSILHIVGVFRHCFARCVDIYVSTSCYTLTIACGAI
jgi:hypothetical protein